MTQELRTIKALWIGGSLGQIEHLCLTSFLACGHDVELFTYEDVGNVPSGVTLRRGEEVLSADKIFRYAKGGSVAAFSNWFRYELLYREGGIWVDTDMICLKPLDIHTDLFFGKEASNKYNTAVLGADPGHGLFQFMAKQSESPNNFLPYDRTKIKIRKLIRKYFKGNQRKYIKWGEIGPNGLTNAINHLGLADRALPVTSFYPIHFSCWDTIFDETYPEIEKYFPDTYAIHLWNEMTNRKPGFDKNGSFPSNSLFEALKRRYL